MNTLLLTNKLKYLFKALLFCETEQSRSDVCNELNEIYCVLSGELPCI